MSEHQIELSEHLDQFVQACVRSGRFGSINDVVTEGLRLLEQEVTTLCSNVSRETVLDQLAAEAQENDMGYPAYI